MKRPLSLCLLALLPHTAIADQLEADAALLGLRLSSTSSYYANRERHREPSRMDFVRENHTALLSDISRGYGATLDALIDLYQPRQPWQKIKILRQEVDHLASLPAAQQAKRIDAIMRS